MPKYPCRANSIGYSSGVQELASRLMSQEVQTVGEVHGMLDGKRKLRLLLPLPHARPVHFIQPVQLHCGIAAGSNEDAGDAAAPASTVVLVH